MFAGTRIWEPIQCRTRTHVYVNAALEWAVSIGLSEERQPAQQQQNCAAVPRLADIRK